MKAYKRKRGKAYDMDRIIDMYDDGHSYEEIASELGINSVQSLRHSVEKFLREREKKWKKISEEREKKEEEETKERRRIAEEKKRRLEPPVTGIMDIYADYETIAAFNQACDGFRFIHNKYHGIEKYYSPQSIPEKNEGRMKGGYWLYLYDIGGSSLLSEFVNILDRMSMLKEFLFAMGFYLTVERGTADGSKLMIYAMHEREGSSISEELITNGYIHVMDGGSCDDMIKSLTEWTARGIMNLDNINDIRLAHFQDHLEKLRDGLRKAGYHLRLHHDPTVYMEERGKSFILSGEHMIVVNKISRDNILERYNSLGDSPDEILEYGMDGARIIALNEVFKYGGGKGMSYDEIMKAWIEGIKSRSIKRVIRDLNPFMIPTVGDRGKLEGGQDFELIRAFDDILNGKIILESLLSQV
jgi:uncharacterized protein (DUF433 family)